MKNLHTILLAGLLLAGATASTTQAANSPTSSKTTSTLADYQAGKQYGRDYAAEIAREYGYGTPTFYSLIENEYDYADRQQQDPNSPQPADFWRGVKIGVYN